MDNKNYIYIEKRFFVLTDIQWKHLLQTIIKKGDVWVSKNYPLERTIKWTRLVRKPAGKSVMYIWDLKALDKKLATFIMKNIIKK